VCWPRGGNFGGEFAEWMAILDAIAMAPRLTAAQQRLAEFADGSRSGAEILRSWKSGVPAESCDGGAFGFGNQFRRNWTLASAGSVFNSKARSDMRMDTRQALTAADLVNVAGAEELARIFGNMAASRIHGGLRGRSRMIASAAGSRRRGNWPN